MQYNTNRLTLVSSKVLKKGKMLYSKYICACGNERYYPEYVINKGKIKSCGCLKKERISKLKYKDGLKAENLKLYQIWASMRKRCNKEKDKAFSNYGARGISVCDEWNNSFKSFYDWSISNGYIEGILSIDRRDNNGNYCPENCRWVNKSTQTQNTRRSIGIIKANLIKQDFKSGAYTDLQIAHKYGTSRATVQRIKYKKTYISEE